METNYTAYGLKIAGISSKAFDAPANPYQYQGDYSEYDDETQWNDFALRNYDPQIGRFVQADPYDQFPSPYTGMGNDPINNVDPSGGWLEGLSAVSQFAIKHFAPALIGAVIGAATTKGDASDKLQGAAWGFGIGMAASYVATSVNWGAVGNGLGDAGRWVGNLFQQNPTLFLEFAGKAYDYKEGDKVRQYGVGDLVLKDKKTGTEIDSYKAISGPGGNGLLPDSKDDGYDYKKPEITPDNAPNRFLYETNDKFSFKMRMVVDKVGSRSALLIHSTKQFKIPLKNKFNPDAEDLPGVTDGCIGLCGGPEESHRFYERMVQYFRGGNKSIKVKVKIDGNRNVKVQLK